MVYNQFQVNPTAENVGNAVAKVILTTFIILAIICFIAGLVGLFSSSILTGAILLLCSILVVTIGLICWAAIKIFVNISRSLYNINDILRQGNVNNPQPKDAQIKQENYVEGAKFQAGQLVIVKADESQYRINEVIPEDGKFKYFSKKFNKAFSADEIEDFDKYWKDKKTK